MVVAVKRRRRVDDDEVDESDFDPMYPRHMEVIRDGGRVRARMALMNGLPSWLPPRRAQPMMDARSYQRVLDGYSRLGAAAGHRPGQVSLTDSKVRYARTASEDARDAWIMEQQDAWKGAATGPSPGDVINGPDDDDDAMDPGDAPAGVSEADLERARWIDRMSNAWRDPVGRGAYAGPDLSHGYGGPSGYAEGVWSAQNAIRPGSAYAVHQVEAARRKTTRESPTDAALSDRDAAYGEYLDYIQNAWKRACG
jgi:hypothetical protein